MNHKKSPKSLILERGLKPKKSFGQNFMLDENINATLLSHALFWGKNNTVLEIGAGTGSLTAPLLESFTLVHAVERDRDLLPILRERFADDIIQNKLILHEADGARFDIASVFSKNAPGILVGNLPYHLTSSIIILALKNHSLLKGAVFLIQKEVADRLCAPPNTKDYGFLTAILNLAFVIQKVAKVDKSAFWPSPRVDSAIIRMSSEERGIHAIENIDDFLVFVRSIFQKRRKMLSTILSPQITKSELLQININPDLRPEQLEPGQFVEIYRVFCSK